MFKLLIIGIADPCLSEQQYSLLSNCRTVFGTVRHRTLLHSHQSSFELITPLAEAIDKMQKALESGNVAVLTSGDPLFYGLARKLTNVFPIDRVEIYPALSSIQRACALFKLPWDDARITSLHGRSHAHIPGVLLRSAKHFIFTDSKNSPDNLARQLIDHLECIGDTHLLETLSVLVAEDLGLDTQALYRGTLLETSSRKFSPLNVFCLIQPEYPQRAYRTGLSEDSIHHSRGLITKNEVRAATLHRLQLPPSGIFWDVGAGSGSISIEAASANPDLTVYAVEHKDEEIKNIKRNIVKFHCHNIVPVFGKAPEALAALPSPDRIFIGGSGGALEDIISLVSKNMNQGGKIVINGVIEKTITEAPKFLRDYGFNIDTSVIRVSRTDTFGSEVNFNPITIICGTR